MLFITDLLSQRPILEELAHFISTLDLYHLGFTCRTHHSYIQPSQRAFEVLRRECLCDGRGLAYRQSFRNIRNSYRWGDERKIWKDEPIEVRLFNTKCDVEALPCIKCGINICEECRDYPREPSEAGYPFVRPHLNSPWQNENLMCLCDECDAKLEDSLKSKFLNGLCDCDVFTRWICRKCVRKEQIWTSDYYQKHTASETGGERAEDYDEHREHTKRMGDHQFDILFFCMCGAFVPKDARPRCTWCNRRHLPESEWGKEWEDIGSKEPFDEDPCYPPYIGNIYNFRADSPYPTLAYEGPIWQASES